MSATKKPRKARKQNKKKKDKRKQVHMHTGNTMVGKLFI